ncbi:MAG: vanadium-dependent haloperoxidase [Prosthecobacter sp.]|nr:vanadium-dependent haloperoxidase [Prosthecobacter sp.]
MNFPGRLRVCAAVCALFCTGVASLRADIVGQWNDYALTLAREAGMSSPELSRLMAMLNISIYNAVEGIAGDYELYTHGSYTGPSGTALPGASMQAAAATAAHTLLYSLYGSNASIVTSINALYSSQMDLLPDDQARLDGLSFGYLVASDIYAWRNTDGAADAASTPYTPLGTAGHWGPTPPDYEDAALPGWGSVATFAISGTAPYAGSLGMSNTAWMTTAEYTSQFNNVKDLGSATSGTRTAEQTDAAYFWEGAPGTITNIGLWNNVAAGIVSANGLSLQDTARLYAALNVTLADAAIVAWDTKYAVDLWSPISAIRDADVDGNAGTAQDAGWQSLLNAPNSPSYFAEQAIFGAAAAGILEAFAGTSYAFTLGSDTDGDGIVDITLNFSSLAAARDMAVLSGLWGGIYFERALADSATSGSQLADAVLGSQFAAVPEPSGLLLLAVSGLVAARRRRRVRS